MALTQVSTGGIKDGTISNADLDASAAIDGSKVSPDFGSQNITTTGTVTGASLIPSSSTVPANGVYLPAANSVGISTNGTGRLFVDSTGKVGLGTSSVDASSKLHVKGQQALFESASGGSGFILKGTDPSGNPWRVGHLDTVQSLQFSCNNALSQMTLDSSGRLGVGTTPGELLHVYNSAATSRLIVGPSGTGAATPNALALEQENTGYTVAHVRNLYNNAGLAELRLGGYGFTTFTSGSSQTERARIDSSGRLLVGTSTALGNYHQFNALSTASNYVAIVGVHNATNDDVRGIYSFAPNCTTADGFLYFGAVGADVIKFAVRTDGDVQNVNNSYGAYSDVRLKENIVDAASQWDDIKNLQVRKYNYKENTGHATHTQIGLIAQEVELVSPGLVGESQAEPLGDSAETIKTINYSVLYMKAVKALQEAMERIETLEAKVAALESA